MKGLPCIMIVVQPEGSFHAGSLKPDLVPLHLRKKPNAFVGFGEFGAECFKRSIASLLDFLFISVLSIIF